MIMEVVYLGRDNTIDLKLLADGVAVDLAPVTRMVLMIETTVIDSTTTPSAFDWDTGVTGKIILFLGNTDGLPPGKYKSTLIVYDASNPNGLVWSQFALYIDEI